jgi:hypothetical protein
MKRPQYLILFFCILLNFKNLNSFGQSSDTVRSDSPIKKNHAPRNAAIRSAIIPGWGQFYNKSYWKIPIIYGAGTVIGLFYIHNRKVYIENRDLLNNNPTSPYANNYKNERDRFRGYRDWNIAMMLALYFLNIVDANVDAHLKEFDINDNLAFTVKPYLYQDLNNRPFTGLSFNLKFKQ